MRTICLYEFFFFFFFFFQEGSGACQHPNRNCASVVRNHSHDKTNLKAAAGT